MNRNIAIDCMKAQPIDPNEGTQEHQVSSRRKLPFLFPGHRLVRKMYVLPAGNKVKVRMNYKRIFQ
jgi:hypothetical protein